MWPRQVSYSRVDKGRTKVLAICVAIALLFTIPLMTNDVRAETSIEIPNENWPVFRLGYGIEPDMALDQEGRPHLAYQAPGSKVDGVQYCRIIYGVFDNGLWESEDLGIDSELWGMRLALDSDDVAHICYVKQDDLYHLMHATNSPGQWQVETLASFDTVVGACRMVLDHEGDAHILLYEDHSYDFENRSHIYRLHHLWNEGGEWRDEVIDNYQGTIVSQQLPTAELAVDSRNEIHVAYTTRNSVGENIIRTAVLSNGTWRNNPDLGIMGWSSRISLQLDADCCERLLYQFHPQQDYDNPDYRLAKRTAQGWSGVVVESGDRGCQLIVDPQGVEHFALADRDQRLILGTFEDDVKTCRAISPSFYHTMTYPAERDFMSGYGNDTWLVLEDALTGDVLLSHQSDNPKLFPHFTSFFKNAGRTSSWTLQWGSAYPGEGPAVSQYVVHWSVWEDGVQKMTKVLTFGASVRECIQVPYDGENLIRLSAITVANEEYLGGLMYLEYDDGSGVIIFILAGLVIMVSLAVTGNLRTFRRFLGRP